MRSYNSAMESAIKEKILAFCQKYPHKFSKKNEKLLGPEKSTEGVFILLEGAVRMFTISKDGIDLSLNLYKPVSFFPMEWVLNDTTNKYHYETLIDSTYALVPKEDMKTFLEENSDILMDLLQRIYKGLGGYFLRMESLLTNNAYFRIVIQLIIQYRRFGEDIKLTHAQIASLTGLSRETVTREIKKLFEKDILIHDKHTFRIIDVHKLETELQ